MHSHRTLFLDTNVLLHYPPLDQMDWREVAQSDSVTLCLCITVIQQLDNKKSDSRLGKRARDRIRQIESLNSAGGAVRDGVSLVLLPSSIRQEDFPLGFDPNDSDDRILLHAKTYGEQHAGTQLAVVSEDLGMRLKCEQHGVSLITPDQAGERLDDPADADGKLLKQTLEKLRKYENRQPSLQVSIADTEAQHSDSHADLVLAKPTVINAEAMLALAKANYPQKDMPGAVERVTLLSAIGSFAGVDPSEYKRYNDEAEQFLAEYRQYVEALVNYWQAKFLSAQFRLSLNNSGTAPAEKIDVHLHFPDGFVLNDADGFLQPPSEPTGPCPPRSRSEMISWRGFHMPIPGIKPLTITPKGASNVSTPRIKRTNSYDVDYSVSYLKHGYVAELGALEIVFSSSEVVRGFEIQYVCTTANMPEPSVGRLHVNIMERKP